MEREPRKLSRKEHGSANSETQRCRVAERHADLERKCRDSLHTLSNYYAREYDLAAVEDLNVKWTTESPSSSRNTAPAAWQTFLSLLEHECEREDPFHRSQPERDDKGVCVPWRFDGEAVVSP